MFSWPNLVAPRGLLTRVRIGRGLVCLSVGSPIHSLHSSRGSSIKSQARVKTHKVVVFQSDLFVQVPFWWGSIIAGDFSEKNSLLIKTIGEFVQKIFTSLEKNMRLIFDDYAGENIPVKENQIRVALRPTFVKQMNQQQQTRIPWLVLYSRERNDKPHVCTKFRFNLWTKKHTSSNLLYLGANKVTSRQRLKRSVNRKQSGLTETRQPSLACVPTTGCNFEAFI